MHFKAALTCMLQRMFLLLDVPADAGQRRTATRRGDACETVVTSLETVTFGGQGTC